MIFVLINVADAIKETAEGKEAYTCRLSKDAFAIYIPDCDLVDARSMRQELNDRLKEIYVGEKEENSNWSMILDILLAAKKWMKCSNMQHSTFRRIKKQKVLF